jgi:GT2 family glycosyltransferase/glycosyltransferase involved in cell wall biosynthesis/tetratricopeptide (TPR) repeat protein/SAM-dependent methyltransferase
MNIGLVGWDVATGLGHYNQDLARHLGVCKWLVPQHPHFPASPEPPLTVCRRTSLVPEADVLHDFLDGLDWLLCVETPYIMGLPALAHQRGVRVALIPMAENFDPQAGWLNYVDLVMPPTQQCAELVQEARTLFDFSWRMARLAGAVDTDRFHFRQRAICRRFLFTNGRGGYEGRKGVHCLAAAARLVPDMPILLYSQTLHLPPLPDNVEVRAEVVRPEELYQDGDICVQPSRWEGLGLPLLEAQACGLPLVTTDGPPMTEYRPYRLIRATCDSQMIGGRPVPAYEASPDHLARILRELWRQDIGAASAAARLFVEAFHSWTVVAPQLLSLLADTSTSRTGSVTQGAQKAPSATAATETGALVGSWIEESEATPPATEPIGRPTLTAVDGTTACLLADSPCVRPELDTVPLADVVVEPGAASSAQHGDESLDNILALIPPTAQRVLHLGCGTGTLGAALKTRRAGLEVIGVERDPRSAERARVHLDAVLETDVESAMDRLPDDPFDLILCGRFLEVTRDPEYILACLRQRLASDGRLIARVNNVRHHHVVRALLDGTWTYVPPAPLHEDQLRFYTRRESEKLFYRAGFTIEALRGVLSPEHTDWRAQRPRDRVQCGGLHIGGLAETEAEEFYLGHYVVNARRAPDRDDGLTSIVMLTHNQLPFTRMCVDSIRRFTDEPYELIVVDNASTDGTHAYLDALAGVQVITNETNRGFPAAANQGIRAAKGEHILLLNNDTVATTGWLRRLLDALHSDAQVGLAGPCSNCVSGEQQIPVSYDDDLTGLDGFAWDWGKKHSGVREGTDRLVGFCLLLRREVVDAIGLLDERFGQGCFEDDDFCRRALLTGYRAVIARDAFVHHFGGRTFIGTGVDFAGLMRRNERLYREKWAALRPATSAPPQPADRGLDVSAPRYAVRKVEGGGLRLERQVLHLSLCMIVRDNARTIRPCLESIRPWVDEMIVVDTGSNDETPHIAEELGARVFYFPWCDSFSAARNESLRHARGQWIFWMDSDDVIDAANGRKLRMLAHQDHDSDLLGHVMQVHCPGADHDGQSDITVVDHVKLIRNRPDLRFEGRIHEQILPAIRRAGGHTAWTDVFVVHSGYDHSPKGQKRKIERDLRLLHLELQEQPEHPFTLFNLGMTYADQGHHTQAVTFLRRSIELAGPGESHLRKAYALLVYSLSQMGQADDARAACCTGLDLFPRDVELRFRRALLLHEEGRLAEAAAMYEGLLLDAGERHFTSIDVGISGFKARQNLALVYTDLGILEKAEAQWRHIVAEQPHYRPGWRGLTDLLFAQKRHDDVRAIAERLASDPHLRADARILESRLALCRGEGDEAQRLLEQAVAEYPEDPEPRQALCRYLFERGLPAAAVEALRELTRRSPTDAAAYHNLGIACLRLGFYVEALDGFQHSLRLRPHSAGTLFHLGHALSRLGRTDEALAAWQEALQHDPAHTAAQEAVRSAKGEQTDLAIESHDERRPTSPTHNQRVSDAESGTTGTLGHSGQPRLIHILNPQMGRGYGLDKHAEVLRRVLIGSGYQVETRRGLPIGKDAWACIHLEHLRAELLGHAVRDFFVPMPEHFAFRELLPRVHGVLACTRQTETVFRQIGVPTYYTGFASLDVRIAGQSASDCWLHLAGASSTKNTQAVLDCWARHPEYPRLIVMVSGDWSFHVPAAANLDVRRGYLATDELRVLQNACRIHICPSAAEGWGHYLVEAMSTGAVVLTTDAPAMNEHVTAERGVLVRTSSRQTRGLVHTYSIHPEDLADAVHRVLALGPDERSRLGEAARQYTEQLWAEFPARLRSALDQLCKTAAIGSTLRSLPST